MREKQSFFRFGMGNRFVHFLLKNQFFRIISALYNMCTVVSVSRAATVKKRVLYILKKHSVSLGRHWISFFRLKKNHVTLLVVFVVRFALGLRTTRKISS